ncbi:MAG: hypothetical protein GWO16_11385 [Gammaproteobacteria bacterium]|nr:hypothetical protein [Gammaproteobacteria bacterium]NIR98536.1 hypothetical protein [Gammaproteobacteria bacterium]NIT64258.1 hypothetical protein [Gammaproteobacteria bacterium]NIV21863.1 hypothetical protein [Gammaproteobacteria bacterium]NIY32838.1 hypothetical protein [Gammaproteobacteria bacterium]
MGMMSLLWAPVSMAGSGYKETGQERMSFQDLDADSDGQISREEAEKLPSLQNKFDSADANRDGSVSSAEFAAFEVEEMEEMEEEEGD